MILTAAAVSNADRIDVAAQISGRAVPPASEGADHADTCAKREKGLRAYGRRVRVIEKKPQGAVNLQQFWRNTIRRGWWCARGGRSVCLFQQPRRRMRHCHLLRHIPIQDDFRRRIPTAILCQPIDLARTCAMRLECRPAPFWCVAAARLSGLARIA